MTSVVQLPVLLPHQMIRIKRSEPTSQLSTDIGLVYFKCKDQGRGCPNTTLDGTLNVYCREYYVWI